MSAWSEYKKKLGDTRPWDVLNPNVERVSDDIAKSRMDVCLLCPRFFAPTSQCRECGCVMTAKTKLAAATCPLGKW